MLIRPLCHKLFAALMFAAMSHELQGDLLYGAGSAANGSFDSTKTNMPSVRFGNAVREAQRLVFISKEHDKTSGGIDSPGGLSAALLSRNVAKFCRPGLQRRWKHEGCIGDQEWWVNCAFTTLCQYK